MTASLIGKAQRMYDARQFTMAEIATSCGVNPMTIYRHIHTDKQPKTDRRTINTNLNTLNTTRCKCPAGNLEPELPGRQNIPNLVIVPVGADGKIQLFNGSGGTVQLIAGVAGYILGG